METILGEHMQIPPMYSAIKQNGVPLYELARLGKEVERAPRKIHIHRFELLQYDQKTITFEVHVSKGTYVRTLGEQLAEKIGMKGHLTTLKRTSVGAFHLDDAQMIIDLKSNHLLTIRQALKGLPTLTLTSPVSIKAVMDGKAQAFKSEHKTLLLIDEKQAAIAIYQKQDTGLYTSLRGLF
jgi:tRNA pseudouridine55 synthase